MEKFTAPEPAEKGSTSTAPGPWAEAAKDDFKELTRHVRDHLRETPQPESLVREGRHTPDDITGFRIIARYDVKPKDDRARDLIPCAFSGHLHYKGLVIWFPDGYLYLIGHKCGDGHFGAGAYSRELARYEKEHAREQHIESAKAVLPHLAPVLRSLPDARGALDEYDRVMRGLREDFADPLAALQVTIMDHNSILYAMRPTGRDEIAGFFEEAARKGRGRSTSVSMGRSGFLQPGRRISGLAGGQAIKAGQDPRGDLEKALRKIETARDHLRGRAIDDLPNDLIDDAVRKLREATRLVRKTEAVLAALPVFMDRKQLQNVAKFLNKHPGCRYNSYEAIDRGLRYYDGPVKVAVALRNDYRPPAFDAVSQLELALPASSRRR